MSRKRCKRVVRRATAPTLVALHLNPEVFLQERGAVLAVRGGWATTDHFNVLADCRDMLMLAANEKSDSSAIAACTVAGIALMNMKDRHTEKERSAQQVTRSRRWNCWSMPARTSGSGRAVGCLWMRKLRCRVPEQCGQRKRV